MAFDVITYILSKKYTDKQIESIAGGFHFKGAVDYFHNLPTTGQQNGDVWTVRYRGTEGTEPWNSEFAWSELQQLWIEIGTDYDTLIRIVQTNVDIEKLERIQADLELESGLLNEKLLRESGDIKLENSINNEILRAKSVENEKVDKVYTSNQIYGTSDTLPVSQISISYSKTADSNTIAMRDESGHIKVAYPFVNEDAVNKEYVDYEIKKNKKLYNYINQIDDYLFETQYSTVNIDYNYANNYFKSAYDPSDIIFGGCTGIYKDKKVLRQLDWYYNDGAEFLVRRTEDKENRIHASIAMSCGVKSLTKSFVESQEYSEKYKLVPFLVTDGINDAGLYIQSNVVPSNGIRYDINPTATKQCCVLMVVRYILDYCTSFADIEEFLNTVHIYSANVLTNYGSHFLVAKDNAWEIIELTETGHRIVSQGTNMPNGIMTNFRTTDLRFSGQDIQWESVEPYGIGVERFEIATKAFTENRSFEELRRDLRYTKLYDATTNPQWRTELCGEKNPIDPTQLLTVLDAKNNPTLFEPALLREREAFSTRTRSDGKGTWQTTHSAIYDLNNKSINLCIQERNNKTFKFFFDTTIDVYADKITGVSTINAIEVNGKNYNLPDGSRVDDVRVNGTSVVVNKIADIDLTYLEAELAEEKIARESGDLKLKQLIDLETLRAELAESGLDNKIIAETIRATEEENKKINLLGNESGSGEPYHLPYNIRDLHYDAADKKIKAVLDTITVDNNKTLKSYPLEVEIPDGKVKDVLVDNVSVLNESGIAKIDLIKKVDRSVKDDNGATNTIDNQKVQMGSVMSTLLSDNDTIISFNTASENGPDGILGQIYAKSLSTGVGMRFNITKNGIYYNVGSSTPIESGYELAVQNDVNKKQDKLISGTNIKTIDTYSILGSGNLNIRAYHPFPNGTIYGTLEQVVDAIMNFPSIVSGEAYVGGIAGECTPFGYGNVECTVIFILEGIAVLRVSSSTNAPYEWVYNTAQGDFIWKAFLVEDNVKTINSQSIIGTGDIEIPTSEAIWGNITGNLDNQTDLKTILNKKQNKLTAGTNIKIIESGDTATIYENIQYIELAGGDGDTGVLTQEQIDILIASEMNYIWLNNMHRLDFRYVDRSYNRAVYSSSDLSSDGIKYHSVEISLNSKTFKIYHSLAVEEATTSDNNTYIYGFDKTGQKLINSETFGKVDDVKVNDTSIVENKIAKIKLANNVTTDESGTFTTAQVAFNLSKRITNLETQGGRFLSYFNANTGIIATTPPVLPYVFKAGDYFIISVEGYKKPKNGVTQMTTTTLETETTTELGKYKDIYRYDGAGNWLHETQAAVSFEAIVGEPSDNEKLGDALDAKQDLLISGTNIKTINNNSLLGSGNLDIKSYIPFPTGDLSGTLQQIVTEIFKFSGASAGKVYLGEIRGACTPFDGNGECIVEFIKNDIVELTLYSSNVVPYMWKYNTAANDYIWRKWSDVSASSSGSSSSVIRYLKIDGTEYKIGGGDVSGVKGSAESGYRQGNVNISKDNIGLGNVDNTSDLDKPISNATQDALDEKQNEIESGTANDIVAYSGTAGILNVLTRVTSIDSESTDNEIPTAKAVYSVAGKKLIEIAYAELKNYRDNSKLLPGQQYRITDYICTTTQANTNAANNVFDIIVTADDVNKLNENARAILHDGDTYFANSKLEAWELKYCLDNDTTRFIWADTANGKGIIYYMKDEFNNECYYDFKNIQFKRKLTSGKYDPTSGIDTFCYTFNVWDSSACKDLSVVQTDTLCCWNSIKVCIDFSTLYKNLNDIVFLNTSTGDSCCYNTFGNLCCESTFGDNCYFNTFIDQCYSNTFGKECCNNVFGSECYENNFGNWCSDNTFGNKCYENNFGNSCSLNIFMNNCTENTLKVFCVANIFGVGSIRNTFGNNCQNNTFENTCQNNTFGNYCQNNTFGNNCQDNIFGNYCSFNTFGKYCYINTFGNYCYSNTFGSVCTNNNLVITGNNDYAQYNIFENGVQYIFLQASRAGSDVNCLQNITIRQGIKGIVNFPKVITEDRNLPYSTTYYAPGSKDKTLE